MPTTVRDSARESVLFIGTQFSNLHTSVHILTAVQRLFNQAGYANECKNVPHSREMKKADLHVKDFRLEGIRDVIYRRDTARRVPRLMH